MTRKGMWTTTFLITMALSALVFCARVHAQNMDEDSLIIAEELSIDEALESDLGLGEDDISLDDMLLDISADLDDELALDVEPEKGTEEPGLDDLLGDIDAGDLAAEDVRAGDADLMAEVDALEGDADVVADALAELEIEELPLEAVEPDAIEELPLEVVPLETTGVESIEDLLAADDVAVEPAEAMADVAEEPVAVEDLLPLDDTTMDDLSIDDLLAEEPTAVTAPVAVAVDDMAFLDDLEPVEATPAATTAEDEFAVAGAEFEDFFNDVPTVTATPVAATTTEPTPMVEPEFVPAITAPVPVMGAATTANPKRAAVNLLRESEELRRRAFQEHAQEKLTLADEAFKQKDYIKAKRFYEQAQNALRQLGDRPESRADMERAAAGIEETLYRRAQYLRKEGDLENALKMAREAVSEGHPDAASLVERIEADLVEDATPPPDTPQKRWKQEDFKAKAAMIRDQLREGREFFIAEEYDKAQERFESILGEDPYNTEAIRWRQKAAQKKFDRASAELETTREDMMTQVRQAWNPGDYADIDIAQQRTTEVDPIDPIVTRQKEILDKMEKIVIPEIDFRQANIHDVVEFLTDASVEFDTSQDETPGVNIILKLAGGSQTPAAADTSATGFDFFEEADFGDAGGQGNNSGVELITFRARDLSLLEALETVTDVAGLKYRIEGSIVKILPFNAPDGKIVHRMYPVLPTIRDRVNNFRSEMTTDRGGGDFIELQGMGIGQGDTDWKAFFETLGVRWPDGSSIRYIAPLGQMMVANTAENLLVFEQRLSQISVIPKQIEIEARFVEVNQTDLTSLGFEYILSDQWEIATKKGQEGLPLAQQQRIVAPATAFSAGQRYLTDNLTDTSEGVISAADNIFTLASVLTNPQLTFVLHALEQKGNADLLSAPKVTTQSGMEAQIKVVTEYIYPSDYTIEPGVAPTLNSDGTVQSAGTPPVVTPAEFETREVGVILTVLPEVSTEGEMINLTMSPEVVTEPEWRNFGQTFTDASGNVQTIPIEQPFFKSRSISTSILIYNGATVVMGGMITEARTQVNDKIPLLGDLPIIGRLFRSSYDQSEKRNLLIFVTARLVGPDGRPVAKSNVDAAGFMTQDGVGTP